MSEPESALGAPADAGAPAPESEVFYTFTWSRPAGRGRRKGAADGDAKGRGRGKQPQGKASGKGRGKARKEGDRPDAKSGGPRTFEARPERGKDRIDPDNPFAALASLKNKSQGSGISDGIRIDKWLWHARFCKTRSRASREVGAGHVRVDGDRISKPATQVRPGHVLTFPQGSRIRVVEVLAAGVRRGPAAEAQTLYRDMTPERENAPPAPRYEGKGRPTKRDRRMMGLDRDRPLE